MLRYYLGNIPVEAIMFNGSNYAEIIGFMKRNTDRDTGGHCGTHCFQLDFHLESDPCAVVLSIGEIGFEIGEGSWIVSDGDRILFAMDGEEFDHNIRMGVR